ncbi:hypothetical protein [Paenibacillus thalictri]|uniref:Uncharacterized protein n=1 Tax=Paenibacillus thalictri TaxID=2527873 RepID=A0A4Q9DNC1_9BACL|nr:hypothetical protein [Paenibacillus thalictri]TBL76364.1 hypothetical protein EYB31_20465 [Paenibacillus thalictri]
MSAVRFALFASHNSYPHPAIYALISAPSIRSGLLPRLAATAAEQQAAGFAHRQRADWKAVR